MATIAEILGDRKPAELDRIGLKGRKRVNERTSEEVRAHYVKASKEREAAQKEAARRRAAKARAKRKKEYEIYLRGKHKQNAYERALAIFNAGMTHPSPKRQGRANAHSDIGRYVNNYSPTIEIMEQRVVTKVRVLHVKNAY